MKSLKVLQSQTCEMFADCIIGAGSVQVGEHHHLVMASKVESFLGLYPGAVEVDGDIMFYLVDATNPDAMVPFGIDEENAEHLKVLVDAYDPEFYVAKEDVSAANAMIDIECPFDEIDGETDICKPDPDVEHDMFIEHSLELACRQ